MINKNLNKIKMILTNQVVEDDDSEKSSLNDSLKEEEADKELENIIKFNQNSK